MKLTEDEIITTIWFVVSIAILAVHSVCGRLVTWKSWPVALEFGRVRQAGRQRTMTGWRFVPLRRVSGRLNLQVTGPMGSNRWDWRRIFNFEAERRLKQ